MKKQKTVGSFEVSVNTKKILRDVSTGWFKDLFNKVLIERKKPEDWRNSFILPIFKRKGEIQECGKCIIIYCVINLISHSMKILENIIE